MEAYFIKTNKLFITMDIPDGEKILLQYMMITSYKSHVFFGSIAGTAKALNKSEETIKRRLKNLVDLGLIRKERRQTRNGKDKRTHYIILDVVYDTLDQSEPKSDKAKKTIKKNNFIEKQSEKPDNFEPENDAEIYF